ncbi:MAG: DNA repair protein RadA [Lachnospiraceae bacterium]|nr:DNA repair protein RadA [Lachnospiraceae bacterium]
MAKNKTVFFCKECGHESIKWLGQCPMCKEWDSFVEHKLEKSTSRGTVAKTFLERNVATNLSQVTFTQEERIKTNIGELDRVLGSGIIKGSLVLVGGDPGIGKSTLLLQMCRELSNMQHKVLYVSGEESVAQIKMRADRLGTFEGEMMLLSETNLDVILQNIDEVKPEILVVDSIQTMYKEEVTSSPGSVGQVREATNVLMHIAKEKGIATFIVGHVTKEGTVAGPRVLEHMVDTVLYFEGENQVSYRVLRAVKNRFGSTNEIGVFEMQQVGLVEIKNPSQYMLQGKPLDEPGSVVTATVEGSRTILVEIQALVCRTSFNLPRRTSVGIDFNRVNILLAVLEKRLGMKLAECDAYVNIVGGMRINETSIDLALVMAVISSYRNIPINSKTIIFGEVGLTGEVRAVAQVAQRVSEAIKIGFETIVLPKANLPLQDIDTSGVSIKGVSNVREAVEAIQYK